MSGVVKMILFVILDQANGIVDSDNLPPVLLAPATDLPPVPMTHVINVHVEIRCECDHQCQWHQRQDYAGVIDTGDLNSLPQVSLTLVVNLEFGITSWIFERQKFEWYRIIRGPEQADSRKYLK